MCLYINVFKAKHLVLDKQLFFLDEDFDWLWSSLTIETDKNSPMFYFSTNNQTQDYKYESPCLFLIFFMTTDNINSHLHEQQAFPDWAISPGFRLIFNIILGKCIFSLAPSGFFFVLVFSLGKKILASN